ncbi:MAG: porin family protein [Bacteroidota bacterium]
MLKKVFFLLLILGFGLSSYAQRLTLGPKVGILQSSLTTNMDSLNAAAKQNLEIGVFARISGKAFFIQPEMIYLTKGGIIENASHTVKQEVEIQAIDVPVLLGLKIGTGKLNVHLNAGPVFSIPVNKTIKTTYGASFLKEQDFTNFNTSLQAGAGIDVWFLILDVRYQYEWKSMYSGTGTAQGLNMNESNFNISLALKLF